MSRTADSLTLPTAMHSPSAGRSGAGESGAAAAGPSPSGNLWRWANSLLTSRSASHRSAAVERGASKPDSWWKIHLFRGMVNDVRRRAPYYWSDWKDALNYRVVPATALIFFAK